MSWHAGPERGFQPDRAGLRVLHGWRRSELLASQVLYEGVTRDPVPTFDGSQLLRNSSYVSKKAIRVIAQRARGRTCTYRARSTMRGVPAIAANPREGSRLLWFWVKVPNSNSEIGTTRLTRARAYGTQVRIGLCCRCAFGVILASMIADLCQNLDFDCLWIW